MTQDSILLYPAPEPILLARAPHTLIYLHEVPGHFLIKMQILVQ